MRGLVCILLLALSALLGALASLWMASAAPVVRLAIWLSDRAKAIDPSPTLNPEKTDEQI